MKKVLLIIPLFLLVFCSCRKYDVKTKCTVHFFSTNSLKTVRYSFHDIDYHKDFGAIEGTISYGTMYQIYSLHFKLDTTINKNELSGISVRSLLEFDTISETDYRITMRTDSNNDIVYEKKFKGDSFTASLIEF